MSDERRTVTEIRREARDSHRRSVYLDGERWADVPAEVLREIGVRQGDVVDTAAFAAQRTEIEPRLARERALRLIQYRERSQQEIITRLHRDGYLPHVASAVAAWLVESGLVDDVRFAETFARSLVVSRGFGRARALTEMSHRGIPDGIAREALDAIAPDTDEGARARQSAMRLRRPGDTPERLAQRLARRGFASGSAFAAAREALAEDTDASFEEDQL